MRKLVTTAAAMAVVSSAALAAAPVAQAAVNPPFIQIVTSTGCVPSASSVVGNPGDSFSIIVGIGCWAGVAGQTGGAPITPTVVVLNGASGSKSATFTLGASGAGTFELVTYPTAGGLVSTTIVSVTITNDFVAVPAVTIHDYLQQVGVPASGDCADVDPSVGHYVGFPVGGWSKSWATWINDGAGGEVCTRELEERPDGTVVLIG